MQIQPKEFMQKALIFFTLTILTFLNPARAVATFPTTGSCAFLITLPVPYGLVDVTSYAETGYNFMGIMTFNTSTSGTLSGVFENAVYKTNDSPALGPAAYVKDAAISIAPMNDSNGFVGGHKLTVSGTGKIGSVTKQFTFILNAVATNNGNTLMLQTSGTTGPGPGTGVCQF